jgi:hypothetical protein
MDRRAERMKADKAAYKKGGSRVPATTKPGRKQSGLRIPEDTLRAVAIAAAENDVPKWRMADILLRKALGMGPQGEK